MYVAPIAEFLTDLGLAPVLSKVIAIAFIVFALALVCLFIYMIIKLVSKIISIKAKTATVKSIVKFSEERKFSGKLAIFLITLFLSRVVSISPFLSKYLSKIPIYVIIFTLLVVINCILNIAGDVYSTRTIAKKRPIKGLIQVIKIVLPAVTNEVITLVKDTSLARVIGVAEIIMVAERYTKQGLIGPLFSTGLYFLLFNGLLTLLLGRIERKMDYFRV